MQESPECGRRLKFLQNGTNADRAEAEDPPSAYLATIHTTAPVPVTTSPTSQSHKADGLRGPLERSLH